MRATRLPASAALLALAMGSASAAELPQSDAAIVNSGATLFHVHCAGCHGADGSGGATDAVNMTRKVPDLTRLAAANDGRFPFWPLYELVSGAELLPAHAGRSMPIWSEALGAAPGIPAEDAATVVRGRILAILTYLASIQAD